MIKILMILAMTINVLVAALPPQYRLLTEFEHEYFSYKKQRSAPERLEVLVKKVTQTAAVPCGSSWPGVSGGLQSSSYQVEVVVEDIRKRTSRTYEKGDVISIVYDKKHPYPECDKVGPAVYNVTDLEEDKRYAVYLEYDKDKKVFNPAAGIYSFMQGERKVKVDCNKLLEAEEIFTRGDDRSYLVHGYVELNKEDDEQMEAFAFYYDEDVLVCDGTGELLYTYETGIKKESVQLKYHQLMPLRFDKKLGTVELPVIIDKDETDVVIHKYTITRENRLIEEKEYPVANLQDRTVEDELSSKAKDEMKRLRKKKLQWSSNTADKWFEMAELYRYGEGVKVDMNKAVKLYRTAEENGSYLAMDAMAVLYLLGKGVEKDYEQSYIRFKILSEFGYVPAQQVLALHYSDGLGVKQDIEKAKQWLGRACVEGSSLACDRLFSFEH